MPAAPTKNPPSTASPSPVATSLRSIALERPDAIAVSDAEQTLSLAEFDAEVSAMAARIASIPQPRAESRGGDRGTPILPVLVDRSVRSAVALHAVIRAGRAFTPVEATLPESRIWEIFDRLDAPAHAVVAHSGMKQQLPPWVRVLDSEQLDHADVLDEPIAVDPAAIGYIVFTSGSMGGPKGVVRSWGALVEKISVDGVSLDAVVAQVRPFSFSAGLGQLVRVAAGDTLHIIDPRTISVESLLGRLQQLGVTRLSLGASLTSALLRVANGQRSLPLVHRVHLGGEPATWDVVEPIRSLVGTDAQIEVRFSATEVGEVCRYMIGPEQPIGVGPLPIGAADGNPRVRLDPIEGADSPMELVVRDPLALYYLGEPELTASRFFTDDEGGRWWRSGDAVGIDEERRLVHRGRLDDMVKINGMRIEPRETEAAVRSLPGVSEAVAVVHTTQRGRRVLVVHVVIDDLTLTPQMLRRDLRALLPPQLVPAVIMRHDRLAVTGRGKVDVAALRATVPVPWRIHRPRKGFYEPELWLAGMVSRIVDLGEVGVDDDIWDEGLDSLGAVELCAAIADAGLGEIDPTVLMRHTTPTAIVEAMAKKREVGTSAAVVLNPRGTRPAIFAVPGGGGTALAFRSLASALGEDQPLIAVEPRGMHQPGHVDLTIEARVEHVLECIDEHLAADDRCVLLGYSAGAVIALEVCRRLVAQGRPAHLVLLDAVPRGGGEGGPSAGPDSDDRAMIDQARIGRKRVLPEPDELFANRWRIIAKGGGYYEEFGRILREATNAHHVHPVDVDATLIQLHGRCLEEQCRHLVTSLDLRFVGGDHQTMLHPPHVAAMAAAIDAVIANGVRSGEQLA